jgi:hypothetical protein
MVYGLATMRRDSLLFLLSMVLLGSLLSTAGAREEEFPTTKSDGANLPITRSDGTVGYMRPPDHKEVKKLVGYIRDGINRADRSDRPRQYKRVIRTKK